MRLCWRRGEVGSESGGKCPVFVLSRQQHWWPEREGIRIKVNTINMDQVATTQLLQSVTRS